VAEGAFRRRFWHAGGVLSTLPARLLGDADRWAVQQLLDTDPYASAQVAEQVQAFGLAWWRSQARVFGYQRPGGGLESACWLGHNLIPVRATPAAVAAFADLVALNERSCSSIVGEAGAVLDLWDRLSRVWGRAREVRACQPLLATGRPPAVAADPQVRLVRDSELDALLPAAIAMYTEEVGVSPVQDGNVRSYRQRVRDLVRSGRAYARFVDGRAVFKAELAVVTRHTAQVQGVWVAPEWRGGGLGTHAVAAVVADALARVAPSVSLYVNDYNAPARRVYARCGFTQVGTLATVLF
jgi:predicted GNAT family acetyltransferase